MTSEPTYYRCWLDADGKHIWVAHLCLDDLETTMMPTGTPHGWQVESESAGRICPSFHCLRCGTHTVLWLDTVGGDHPLVDDVASVLAEVERLRAELAARDGHGREQRAAAAKAIADKWQTGAWADVLQPYYAGMPLPQTRLGVAQAVTEWLRDQIEGQP